MVEHFEDNISMLRRSEKFASQNRMTATLIHPMTVVLRPPLSVIGANLSLLSISFTCVLEVISSR